MKEFLAAIVRLRAFEALRYREYRLLSYGQIFGKLVAPRLSPVSEREPVAPLRFAQFVGFVFALAGTVGFLAGSTIVGTVATGFALFAALLNAAFGICLGCQIYPLVARLRNTGRATTA